MYSFESKREAIDKYISMTHINYASVFVNLFFMFMNRNNISHKMGIFFHSDVMYYYIYFSSFDFKWNENKPKSRDEEEKKKFSGDQQKLCVVGKIYTESERYEMFTRKQIIKTAKEKFNSLCCRHFSCWPRNKGSEITGKKNLFNKIYNVETLFRATKIFSCIYEIITH